MCAVLKESSAPVDEASAVPAMNRLGDVWEQLYPAERHRIVQLMIERIDLVAEGLRIRWRELGWKELTGEVAPESIGAELVELEAVV